MDTKSSAKVDLTVVKAKVAVRSLDSDVLAKLRTAALDPDRGACCWAVKDAMAHGILREDIADYYIPELARQMGEQWCSDEMGFVDVTIGVSRLQMMLRELGSAWIADHLREASSPAILLIVPEGAHHTLGAMVLAGQLRRKGFSVCLVLGQHLHDIAAKMQQTGFEAVFISSSQSEKLASLRRIVDVAKCSILKPPPVVIGGAILDVQTTEDVKAQTGADHATKRLDEALRLCGLKVNTQDSILMMRGN